MLTTRSRRKVIDLSDLSGAMRARLSGEDGVRLIVTRQEAAD